VLCTGSELFSAVAGVGLRRLCRCAPSPPVEARALSPPTVGQRSVVLERRHAELAVVAIQGRRQPATDIARESQASAHFVILASLCGLSSGGRQRIIEI
jgi:hypothetical protein